METKAFTFKRKPTKQERQKVLGMARTAHRNYDSERINMQIVLERGKSCELVAEKMIKTFEANMEKCKGLDQKIEGVDRLFREEEILDMEACRVLVKELNDEVKYMKTLAGKIKNNYA